MKLYQLKHMVDEDRWEEFCDFVKTGKTTREFRGWLLRSPSALQAVEILSAEVAESFRLLGFILREEVKT